MKEKLIAILDKIKEYDKIILFRHFRPDGDAVGSTKGLQAILKATYPEKTVLLQNSDFSDYLEFLGDEDAPISDEEYKDALGIVIDTATTKRISNKKYDLCREIIKIDHHIPVESYGVIEWVEELRSSSSEMIAAFYDAMREELVLTKEAATYIYCGMVTDSGRFRFRDVSGETMRLAGVMLSTGIDTDTLFANLYLKDFNSFKFEAYARRKMQLSENGVVSLFVTKKMQKKFGLTFEEASNAVSYMDSIKNSLIWIAFVETEGGEVRVRLRSRFVTVNEVAERWGGGGHDCASGANLKSKKDIKILLSQADERIMKYKAENEGWL